MLECWSAGVLECWRAGVLACWNERRRQSGETMGRVFPFSIRYSLFAILHSRFAIRYSLFAILHNPFCVKCSALPFQRPFHCGVRFSRKALTPSSLSSLEKSR